MSESEDEHDADEPEHPEFGVRTHQDTVSYYIYDEDNPKAWIRTDLTIEQSVDNDGFEDLSALDWKRLSRK